jgi:GNAT superfamily N-acetyltransferase
MKIKIAKKNSKSSIKENIEKLVINGPLIGQEQYYFHIMTGNANIQLWIKKQQEFDLSAPNFGRLQVLPFRRGANFIGTDSKPWGVKWISLAPEIRGKGIAVQMQKLGMLEAKKHGATHYCSDDRRSGDGEKFWTRNQELQYAGAALMKSYPTKVDKNRFCIDLSKISYEELSKLDLKE